MFQRQKHHIYLFTYLLFAWSRILHEKRSHLVKKCTAFYRTRSFVTSFTSAHHLSLFWPKSSITSYLYLQKEYGPLISKNVASHERFSFVEDNKFCYVCGWLLVIDIYWYTYTKILKCTFTFLNVEISMRAWVTFQRIPCTLELAIMV